jgi:hypothetical protein
MGFDGSGWKCTANESGGQPFFVSDSNAEITSVDSDGIGMFFSAGYERSVHK